MFNYAGKISIEYFLFRLIIEGQKMTPCLLQDLDESSPLYEEIIAMDGNLVEFFAFDNTLGSKIMRGFGDVNTINLTFGLE